MTACAAVPEPDQTDAYAQAQEQFDSIKSRLRSSSAKAWTVSDLENFLETESRELLRRFAQGYLDEQGPGEVAEPVTDSNRQKCTHQRLHSRTITTIFGNVTLRRQGYGGRGFKSLHPLDAKLNLPPEIYTHSLRRRMSEEAAKESFDETQGDIRRQTGVSVPKRQIEQSVCRAAQDFDQFYEQQRAQALPDSIKSGLILALTVDLKGVSMRKIDLREATRKTAEGRAHKMRHRRSPGEKSGTKRMATVAAVYNIEPFERTPEQIVRELGPVRDPLPRRPRPEDKRVWASIKQSPKTIIEQAFDEATRRDPNHVKQWVALVDGSELQLDLLLEAAKKRGIKLVIILDLIHVLEYLWKAAWALHKAGDRAAETWVGDRLAEILRGHSSLVAAGMRRSATLRGLSKANRAPIDVCANYLLKYREFLRYDRYLAKGYPIATGVIEGACRYLVKDRMEITGARWRLNGAEAILRLRSLRASGDFDEYWKFHLQKEYERNHAARYLDGKVPQPKPAGGAKRPDLKLVN